MTHSEILTMLGDYVDYLIANYSAEAPMWNIEKVRSGKPNKWNYIDGCMITACLSLYHTTGDQKYLDFSKNFIDYFVQEDGSIQTYDPKEYNLDNVNQGKNLFTLYDIYGEEKYRKAIDVIRGQLETQPRTKEGNFWHKDIYPWQVWLYGGLCPFHSEKTPSFYVYPDTQSFYCFGCQAAGDAISFVKKINNISSGEAIKMLASRAGMPEPQEDDKTGRLRSRVLSMNKEAARFFHACLNSTVEEARQARAYWRRRGLDDKTIVRFGLGYAPNDGQALYQYLRDKGYNQQELDASGLFKRSQSGRIYCLFWKRVMTPIFDLRGNIIAFGGRVMDDSKPKYVNSPETLVYHKSETVFAMQIAKRSASRRFVLCEGYMDVISMQQAGIDTAVCACGTALTPGQVRIISEYADEVILSYDSDEAGQKATLRSLELFRNSPVKVGVLQIPGAKDPDEYIKKYGPERFQALLDGVGNALDFRLKRLRDQYDLSQDAQRLQYVKEAVEMLAERSNPTEQEVYAGRLAEETNISKTAILAQLGTAAKRAGGKYRREKNRELLRSGEMDQIKVPYSAGGSQALGIASAQQRLLAAILREPRYLELAKQQLTAEQFIQPQQKELYEAMLNCSREGVELSLTALRAFASEEALNELSRLAAQYSDVNCTPEDIHLYLDRIARGMPVASKAAAMSGDEITQYLQSMREKKQGTLPEQD